MLVIGGVCILRHVKYSVCSNSTELPVGMVVCMQLCNPMVWVRSHTCVIFFFRVSIYFVSTIKFNSYFFSLFHCIMPLIQLNAFFNHS